MPDIPTLDEAGCGYELTVVRHGGAGEDPAACARAIDAGSAQGSGGCAVQRTMMPRDWILSAAHRGDDALMQADTRKWVEVINKTGARIAQ